MEEYTMLTPKERSILLVMQRNELTESIVYARMAKLQKDVRNTAVLEQIGSEEKKHEEILRGISGEEASSNMFRVAACVLMARFLGISFGLKYMERRELKANRTYLRLQERFPELKDMAEDEEAHETALLSMLNDGLLSYMGSIVLGLNDALVELTGALAGFTFALPSPRLVAITGLITGLSASMSMAASGYLSARAEKNPDKPPFKSAFFTGMAYVVTVILLVTPFFVFGNPKIALATALAMAFIIIAVFNYYISVACNEKFWPRFMEMASLSGGVAVVSFLIGMALNHFIPVSNV